VRWFICIRNSIHCSRTSSVRHARAVHALLNLIVTAHSSDRTNVCTMLCYTDPGYRDDEDVARSPFYPTCYEAKSPLMDGWRLFFFRTERVEENGQMRIKVLEPFFKVETATMPKYDSRQVVCGKQTRDRCNELKTKPSRRPGWAFRHHVYTWHILLPMIYASLLLILLSLVE